AIEPLKLAIAAGNRVSKDRWYEPAAESMLPGENPDPTAVVPAAYSTADLMAWAHYHMGQALGKTGNSKDARIEYAAAVHCQSDAPPVVDVGMRIRLPVAHAAMELARDYLKHNDARDAMNALNGHGPSREQDQKLWQEYMQLFDQVRQQSQNGNWGPDPS